MSDAALHLAPQADLLITGLQLDAVPTLHMVVHRLAILSGFARDGSKGKQASK